ncbi:hypothetical protein M0R45_034046 [Rubus argutus]|uniref:Cystatin domain-containing protein n=1 Tax=Rubus argutus TaxID=59490 RepID=A0AAW1VSN0_RUBAR
MPTKPAMDQLSIFFSASNTSLHRDLYLQETTSTVARAYLHLLKEGQHNMKEIAEFAVSEYNQYSQKKKLVFQSVVRGETQVVAGIKYRLVITVKDDDDNNNETLANYEGVVWEKSWIKFRKLISFNEVKSSY